MGEEEKKPADEEKKEEKKAEEDSKEETPAPPPPPPPPQEIVLKVFMHCEGCARKVRKSLKGFPGVEDVITDCKSSTVVVKGEKAAADPLKVLERVQRKSHRQVLLISPIPKPLAAEENKPAEEEPPPKLEEKKEEPKIITVVFKVYMHCEACSLEIKKRIQRMKGVESAEPDIKSSEVTVKGVFEPKKLVDYVYKRTGKHAVIVKQEPPEEERKSEENNEAKEESKEEEKKSEEGDSEEQKVSNDDNKSNGDGGDSKEEKNNSASDVKDNEMVTTGDGDQEIAKVVEVKNEYNYHYYYYPPKYTEIYQQPYPPQIFSDENPDACSVM